MKYSIPDKRELTKSEIEFLTFLFEKEKSEWTNLIRNLKVIARCGCGKCPTIILGKTFDSEIQKGNLIIDYVGKSKSGELIGISVFGTEQMPTELEFYSIDGESEILERPEIETLKSITENLT
ncbi:MULTISPECIES: hypothetical protein [unclassified Arenibacter]|uniref:hypothetical protein n=1 Tax=unclassified Arenibacter TaxID=2615047 RepID=UPI000E34640D|nr:MULTISPECIES: hypothetical protein [unclassified Arenibacter]MCM4164802.1 hypothetical protein [Arenibacter sp. A80]RFT55223.1 hypothetical protein D0S24_14450 [Arenibacter sp. P308M17]